jgi:hypothetical protein
VATGKVHSSLKRQQENCSFADVIGELAPLLSVCARKMQMIGHQWVTPIGMSAFGLRGIAVAVFDPYQHLPPLILPPLFHHS